MPVVSIRHRTTYRYRNPVAFGEHRMMLRPMEAHDQRIISARVEVSPEPSSHHQVFDATGASVGVARFMTRADRLVFESLALVDHQPTAPFELEGMDGALGQERFTYGPGEQAELQRAIARAHPDDGEVEAWARRFVRPLGRTRLSSLLSDMCQAIRADCTYSVRLNGPPQTPLETLRTRTGSCRDFAVLMIEAARSLGLAARFASGYVYSSSPKTGRTGGGHTHAWARVFLPVCGWVDFDPTNGLIGGFDLIRVTATADPRDALPLHGTWSGLRADYLGMDVEVDIEVQAEPALQLDPPRRIAQAG